MPWTEDEKAELVRLYNSEEKPSYTQIGEALGKNKNQCIGMMHRIEKAKGLPPRVLPVKVKQPRKKQIRKKKRPPSPISFSISRPL